jgi:ubiquinol-cytochrome c reductase iron-sulfur subunit
VATVVPFVSTFAPSERAKAAGAPVEVDIGALQPGEKMTVEWRGKPVWILRRTPEHAGRPEEARGRSSPTPLAAHRSTRRPSTRRTCTARSSPSSWWRWASARTWAARRPTSSQSGPAALAADDWQGGFLCPCHGSTFDFAGRVFKNKPAPDNLEVPPHMYLSDTVLLIGEDKKA